MEGDGAPVASVNVKMDGTTPSFNLGMALPVVWATLTSGVLKSSSLKWALHTTDRSAGFMEMNKMSFSPRLLNNTTTNENIA